MGSVLMICGFTLNILNVFLHGVSLYALISLYLHSKHKVQRLFLINMSLCHLIVNSVQFCMTLPDFLSLSSTTKFQYNHNIEPYVELVASTGLKAVFYLTMLFFTADRLVHAILCLRYPIYWSIKKTKYLLFVTWMFGILTAIVVSLAVVYVDFHWQRIFYTYFYPSVDLLFLFTAILTYLCIVRAYFHSKRRTTWQSTPERTPSVRRQKNKVNLMEFRQQYAVAMCLILLFMLFVAPPDLVFFSVLLNNPATSSQPQLKQVCRVTYSISNICTVVVYIWFLDDFRKWLQLLSYFTVLSNVVKYCPPFCLKVQRDHYSKEKTSNTLHTTVPEKNVVFSNKHQMQGRESPCLNGRVITPSHRQSLPVHNKSNFLFQESPSLTQTSVQLLGEGVVGNRSAVLADTYLDSSSGASSSNSSISGKIDRKLLNRDYMKSLRESTI